MLSTDAVEEIQATVAPFTMVHATGVQFAMEQTVAAIEASIPGVIVECGVWKGGASLAMLLAQRAAFGKVVRPVHLLDSFAGLPRVELRDGPLAAEWQAGADPEKFFDNCTASRDELEACFAHHGFVFPDYVVWEGWFESTLPRLVCALDQPIALLRLDSDWYASTRLCLETLMPITSEGATVIVDDYYAWDGCARAIHDYLAAADLPYRIKSLPYNFGAYFVKRQARPGFNVF
jgi:hypothetical protein